MRSYVDNFLGCRECASHFVEMAEGLEYEVISEYDGVLWLWASHNKVNNRLQGDATEDPNHPKVQFPIKVACEDCRIEGSQDGLYDNDTVWHLGKVIGYLTQFYDPLNIIDDSSGQGYSETAIQYHGQPLIEHNIAWRGEEQTTPMSTSFGNGTTEVQPENFDRLSPGLGTSSTGGTIQEGANIGGAGAYPNGTSAKTDGTTAVDTDLGVQVPGSRQSERGQDRSHEGQLGTQFTRQRNYDTSAEDRPDAEDPDVQPGAGTEHLTPGGSTHSRTRQRGNRQDRKNRNRERTTGRGNRRNRGQGRRTDQGQGQRTGNGQGTSQGRGTSQGQDTGQDERRGTGQGQGQGQKGSGINRQRTHRTHDQTQNRRVVHEPEPSTTESSLRLDDKQALGGIRLGSDTSREGHHDVDHSQDRERQTHGNINSREDGRTTEPQTYGTGYSQTGFGGTSQQGQSETSHQGQSGTRHQGQGGTSLNTRQGLHTGQGSSNVYGRQTIFNPDRRQGNSNPNVRQENVRSTLGTHHSYGRQDHSNPLPDPALGGQGSYRTQDYYRRHGSTNLHGSQGGFGSHGSQDNYGRQHYYREESSSDPSKRLNSYESHNPHGQTSSYTPQGNSESIRRQDSYGSQDGYNPSRNQDVFGRQDHLRPNRRQDSLSPSRNLDPYGRQDGSNSSRSIDAYGRQDGLGSRRGQDGSSRSLDAYGRQDSLSPRRGQDGSSRSLDTYGRQDNPGSSRIPDGSNSSRSLDSYGRQDRANPSTNQGSHGSQYNSNPSTRQNAYGGQDNSYSSRSQSSYRQDNRFNSRPDGSNPSRSQSSHGRQHQGSSSVQDSYRRQHSSDHNGREYHYDRQDSYGTQGSPYPTRRQSSRTTHVDQWYNNYMRGTAGVSRDPVSSRSRQSSRVQSNVEYPSGRSDSGLSVPVQGSSRNLGYEGSRPCVMRSTEWSACSKSCDTGISTRYNNHNDACEMKQETRICMLRPCYARFPDWTLMDWNGQRCPQFGSTYRASRPRSLRHGGCRTRVQKFWRYCGMCPTKCCYPKESRTRPMDMICSNGHTAVVKVMTFDHCECADTCPDHY